MLIKDLVDFFQICHAIEYCTCQQNKHEAAEKCEHKETNKSGIPPSNMCHFMIQGCLKQQNASTT